MPSLHEEKMNRIYGNVIHKETGIGIPYTFVVEVYDIDLWSNYENPDADISILAHPGIPLKDETFMNTDPDSKKMQGLPADRLVSGATNHDGYFELLYHDEAFNVRKRKSTLPNTATEEKRPDLVLVLSKPEGLNMAEFSNVVFRSNWVRINAGRDEYFRIEITDEECNRFGIPVPSPSVSSFPGMDPISEKIAVYQKEQDEAYKLHSGFLAIDRKIQADKINDAKIFKKQVEEQEKDENQAFRITLKEAILPNTSTYDNLHNFVKPTDSIQDVQQTVYKKGIDQIDGLLNQIETLPLPGRGIKVNIILTDKDKEDLQQYKFSHEGKEYYNIPEPVIQRLLFKRETDEGINTILFNNNPISKACIQKTSAEKCAEIYTGLKDENPPLITNPDIPDNETNLSKEDIPSYVKKVLTSEQSIQYQDKSNGDARPDSASVQKNVDQFILQKGPADTPAYYDFHSLQIAFQYVWHQLLDETLVYLSERVNGELKRSGKKGFFERLQEKKNNWFSSIINPMDSVVEETSKEIGLEIPAAIKTAFDISSLEYEAMTPDEQDKLLSLAEYINLYEGSGPGTRVTVHERGNGANEFDLATKINLKREQGERLIDNVRVNQPHSTNQLLKELQERLLSKYEFTVFAADKDYHSVNFALMTTFRQKWEPVSYQAGRLVKTIPLSPKEERKYSVKTVREIKTTRKEARKNNSTLQNEINSTTRAEAEIIAKTQDKFNLNGSVEANSSYISAKAGFAKDAEKESSQTKKDFREAVIKAAQDYKEERNLEIDTADSYSSEYTESGTIVNPNDELSVTYLFYELQRRYRVSEQLYRVMPVVLVAQEMPCPHHITKAWVTAHDWILNRVLLDDSFRGILQYLSQQNVGDDFAIRELRKNLRYQRTLVSNLKIEFSKLRREVADRYAALEQSTEERIDEEHEKRVYKKWPYYGYFYNNYVKGNELPPDPEMAKAIEQAAADAHKHAVEQAERLSLSLQREMMALQQMTAEYNATMREHLDRMTQTSRLLTHIKSNIMYYMQAVWRMEPPDQRYMRLYKVQVPHFEADRTCIIEDEAAEDMFAQFREPGKQKHHAWLHGKVKRKPDGQPDVIYKQLVEVADLDNLLGFKGNYMIFPLKEHNALTEFMAAPYIDEAFGAMDPDQLSNINLEEFSRYICCLHKEAPAEYEQLKPVLKRWLERLLSDPLRNGDEIVVPTGSLFIEMLPSSQSLLEDFKLRHRQWDVYKVQEEVRMQALENIRYAKRILMDELEDPRIEKKVVVENGDGITNFTITE